MLTSRAAMEVAEEDADEDIPVDEDEDGAVTDLVEHMSNIAAVM